MSTKKHQNFVSKPMEDKAVTDMPGIRGALGKRLQKQGFDKAYMLLGKFVAHKKNTEKFAKWLRETFGASAQQADICTRSLQEWCEIFLSTPTSCLDTTTSRPDTPTSCLDTPTSW
ncbi:barrier-to-autointegration factor-like [Myripristis murdjan]|uniref:barrier-to-autointegration factor-like n=1 Tax=Myripristis murdjan TaxID=586833 RepID=UPI001175C86F|nr:barrier-to-autointegration factor-like [Myripristis murdjan]XP_029927165.1 barrier-to-autointegration factor-like [Myripristis murdjan]